MITYFKLKLRKMLDSFLGNESLKNEIINLLWKMHNNLLVSIDQSRNEILLELKHGQKSLHELETRIINKRKYDRMLLEDVLALNIGAGRNCEAGMINIDMRELPGIDIVADATDIKLPKEIAKVVFSAHVLEHFPYEKLRRTVLPNWISLLKVGGCFRAIVPDTEAMMAVCANGTMSFEDFRTVTFGLQEYEGDIHHTMFSRASLKLLLEEAGLRDVCFIATSRANGLCLEMEVLAYK